ncbi:MAG: hypothetical protein M3O36_02810 [Myxococcota bacterium]|nr:hypothetical protein [Myxococcota bacterium]
MDGRPLADGLVRALLSLGDAALRVSYVISVARRWDAETLAAALDVVCQRAEQAEAASREALVAIVDALNGPGLEDVVQRMREQAAGDSLLALERLIRSPVARERAPRRASTGRRGEVLDDSHGRPLTLGERKSLARRPDRDTMQRLLSDPHPDVIRWVLRNARITEDDVIRFAAKRPGRGELLAEIARSTRWAHRPRVRIALVMNPATPIEIASRVVGLLLRPELDLVAGSPGVSPGVRALCLEHLARRPPFPKATRRSDGIH